MPSDANNGEASRRETCARAEADTDGAGGDDGEEDEAGFDEDERDADDGVAAAPDREVVGGVPPPAAAEALVLAVPCRSDGALMLVSFSGVGCIDCASSALAPTVNMQDPAPTPDDAVDDGAEVEALLLAPTSNDNDTSNTHASTPLHARR